MLFVTHLHRLQEYEKASLIIGLKMGFLHLGNILKPIINKFGKNGLNERKMGVTQERGELQTKGPTTSTISSFFGSIVLCNKDDPHQKQFEEDLVSLIAKELVSLSIVQTPFFRRLVLKKTLVDFSILAKVET